MGATVHYITLHYITYITLHYIAAMPGRADMLASTMHGGARVSGQAGQSKQKQQGGETLHNRVRGCSGGKAERAASQCGHLGSQCNMGSRQTSPD